VAQSKAYLNTRFLESHDARALRILAEYLEPLSRFQRQRIQDTIVFMDRGRLKSHEAASAAVAEAEKTGVGLASARTALELSEYYEAARSLAHRLTEWSKNLADIVTLGLGCAAIGCFHGCRDPAPVRDHTGGLHRPNSSTTLSAGVRATEPPRNTRTLQGGAGRPKPTPVFPPRRRQATPPRAI